LNRPRRPRLGVEVWLCSFFNHSYRRRSEFNATSRSLYAKTRSPLYRRLVGLHGRLEQVRKISPATGILSPDRSAHSESLHRQRYPDPQINILVSGNLLCPATNFPRRCRIRQFFLPYIVIERLTLNRWDSANRQTGTKLHLSLTHEDEFS
jgi:hypothetical protein